MLPEAPTRFSTTTGCPQRAASLSPTMRGSASAAPPAGNGTMTRIGRLGYPGAGSCAHVEAATSKFASHAHRQEFMRPPPPNRSDRHDRILSTKISQEEVHDVRFRKKQRSWPALRLLLAAARILEQARSAGCRRRASRRAAGAGAEESARRAAQQTIPYR